MVRKPRRSCGAPGRPGRFRRQGRWRAGLAPLITLLALTCGSLLTPSSVSAQTVVGCLLSPPEEFWPDMWLDSLAGRLYIADWTNARILVHDTRTLARVGEIPLASFLPDRPQQLAGHEGAGVLYVVVDRGGATHDSRVVVIDTHTLATRVLDGLGWNLAIQVDEGGRRLLVFGKSLSIPYRLHVVDVDSDAILGTVDIAALMDYQFQIGMMQAVNPLIRSAIRGWKAMFLVAPVDCRTR